MISAGTMITLHDPHDQAVISVPVPMSSHRMLRRTSSGDASSSGPAASRDCRKCRHPS
jgi:hypothetical protein